MKISDMPSWATKYKGPKKSLKYLGNDSYGLYEVTSKYDKELGYSRSKQTFIGVITKDKGLVLKKKRIDYEANYLEYGLSHFIYVNFKRDIQRSVHSNGNAVIEIDYLIKLIIIKFVFDSIDDAYLDMSYLCFNDDKKAIKEYRDKISDIRINNGSKKITKLLKEKVEDKAELSLLINYLRLITVRENEEVNIYLNESLKGLLTKYDFKF